MEQVKHLTKEEIIGEMKRAMQDAKTELNELGVLVNTADKDCFKYDPRIAVTSTSCASEDIAGPQVDDCDDPDQELEREGRLLEEIDNDLDEGDRQDIEVLKILFDADFSDFSNRLGAEKCKSGIESISFESTQFVRIPDRNNDLRVVKKSAIVWFLESGVRRLSNDRTYRVRVNTPYIQRRELMVKHVEKRTVRIGDWAIFKTDVNSPLANLFLLGRVLAFSVLVGNKKELNSRILEWDGEKCNVGALCIWYEVDYDRVRDSEGNFNIQTKLKDIPVVSHGFHPCETYVCSLPSPTIDPKSLCLSISSEVATSLKPFVEPFVSSFVKNLARNVSRSVPSSYRRK